jgi:hypothetical protein
MSCYEWERGSIQIPSAAWAKFKADLRAAYNKQAERDFALVEKLHATVKDLIKGKRGVNIAQVLSTEAHAMIESRGYGYYATSQEKYAFKLFDTEDILRKLFVDGKLYAPKKKDFPLANGKTVSFGADYEGRISLRDTDRTVHWDVSENNHAVDRARESYMGSQFFTLLGGIKWTRGSGGHIFGSNEYEDDAAREYAGGGGSHIKDTFGPEGDRAYEAQHGFSRRTLRRTATTSRR